MLDPLGGSLRIRRALATLAGRVDIHRAEVGVGRRRRVGDAGGWHRRARRPRADLRGVQTPALSGPLGVESPHTRFTSTDRSAARS